MKLIIKGKTAYINRMYKHLRKEHPSTRKGMVKVIGKRNYTQKKHHSYSHLRMPKLRPRGIMLLSR